MEYEFLLGRVLVYVTEGLEKHIWDFLLSGPCMEVEAHIENPGKTLLRSTPFPALFIVLWGWKRVFGSEDKWFGDRSHCFVFPHLYHLFMMNNHLIADFLSHPRYFPSPLLGFQHPLSNMGETLDIVDLLSLLGEFCCF